MTDRQSKSLTWWLTGLSGAGKTTLADALAARLAWLGVGACVLDGDALRHGLCGDLGFNERDRAENMRRVGEVARLLNDSGIHAICALISPTLVGRARARAIVGRQRFIEAYIATPLAVCQQRDPKGLYARAAGNSALSAIAVTYEAPLAPEIVIDTSQTSVDQAVDALLTVAATKTIARLAA